MDWKNLLKEIRNLDYEKDPKIKSTQGFSTLEEAIQFLNTKNYT